MVKHTDNELDAKFVIGAGPVKARVIGNVRFDKSGATVVYSLEGEASGGAAEFAKVEADVTLVETEGKTALKYPGCAKIGGKLAQIGSRLIKSTAKKLSACFMGCFAKTFGSDALA